MKAFEEASPVQASSKNPKGGEEGEEGGETDSPFLNAMCALANTLMNSDALFTLLIGRQARQRILHCNCVCRCRCKCKCGWAYWW